MWKLFTAGTLLIAAMLAQDVSKELPSGAPPSPSTEKGKTSGLERQRMSIERQVKGVREQQASFWVQDPLIRPEEAAVFPPAPECTPAKPAEVKSIIDREAGKQNVDARLIAAVVEAESAYVPCAVSKAGAMGLMQLMPDTAMSLAVKDPFDPSENISAGTNYLKKMMDRYDGDLSKALAAYNAGPTRVDAAGGVPAITETQEYVRKILDRYLKTKN